MWAEKDDSRATLAHKECHYRCFLPDLAGFVILCCAGPGYQTEILDGARGKFKLHFVDCGRRKF